MLSVDACQSDRKSTLAADAGLPLANGGAGGAPEAGADQALLDSTEDNSAAFSGVMISPPSADFGDVIQGASSTTPTIFTVTNAGLAVALNPIVMGPFAMVSNTCDLLAAGGECTIGLSFNPVALGASSGVLVVAAGATSILTGTGVTPARLAFQPPTTVSVTPIVGISSSPVGLNLLNSGGSATGALTLTLGGNVDQFTIDNQCVAPLAANSFCRIRVTCKATSGGPKTITLTVTDANSPTTPAIATVNASLEGPPDGPTLSGTGDFGTVAIGATSSAHDFTLANPGMTETGTLTVAVSDTQFVVTSDGCSNLPLAAGKSCTISVVFKPSAVGPFVADVRVSALGMPTSSLPIKGVGAAARSDGGISVDGALGSDGNAGTDIGTGGS